jgi:HEAT repeat protein
MRTLLSVLLATVSCSPLFSQEKKPESATDKLVEKCFEILKNAESISPLDKPTKADAVAALGLLGEERAVPVLVEHLEKEKTDSLRFNIIRALGWIKSAKAVPALEKVLKNDRSRLCRKVAAMVLSDITGKDYKDDK